ncbi:MAG: DUF1638 domain-containing protein [Clostridiales bacterium]|nr:DUF1638 domain-containing protein [Clostridiales bacterium]
MRNAIIACKMISDEIILAMSITNCRYPIIWLDDSLHMSPSKLHDRLQEEIKKLNKYHYDYILFAYGYCGNAFINIESGNSSLVIPKINDCIDMLLYGTDVKSKHKGCYYLTRGWLENDLAIGKEYDLCIQRFGEKRAKRIMDVMLANYNSMVMIDTGAYDIKKYEMQAKTLADRLGLDLLTVKGNIQILVDMFSGKWNDQLFCILEPQNTISMYHFDGCECSNMPQIYEANNVMTAF